MGGKGEGEEVISKMISATGWVSVPCTDGVRQDLAGLRQWPESKRDPLTLPS